PYTIPVGDRLGVALTVERSNTTGDALAIMYDHPRFPTRLEVDTNTPSEGGGGWSAPRSWPSFGGC
ncbi:MAG TPA: hypothetical protein VGV69_06900, partial [Solirubrobacterales bacterium]|nr:hypothetical protein [Solirubrobacterales bacterium]